MADQQGDSLRDTTSNMDVTIAGEPRVSADHTPQDTSAAPSNGSSKATKSSPVQDSSSKVARNSASPRQKSRWKSFFAKLVPCISTSKGHDEPVDHPKAIDESVLTENASPKAESVPLQVVVVAPPTADEKDDSPTTDADHTATPSRSPVLTTTSSVQTDLPPPIITAEELVVVPPSPSKLLPPSDTGGLMSGAVQPPGSTGHEDGDESQVASSDEELEPADTGVPEEEDEDAIVLRGGMGIPIIDGVERPLLPPVAPEHKGRKCLVLDLDETLLHSSFKLIPQCDYVVPVEIEWQWHNVYVIKRPGVDAFLKKMGELFEIVIFTASLSKYADPVLDKLDIHKVVSHRLFRESCYNHKGNYVKDLSQLGRPLTETIILDNSPASYIFHPNNAVPVSSWFNDPHDTELTDLCPFLTDLRLVDDIRGVLDGGI